MNQPYIGTLHIVIHLHQSRPLSPTSEGSPKLVLPTKRSAVQIVWRLGKYGELHHLVLSRLKKTRSFEFLTSWWLKQPIWKIYMEILKIHGFTSLTPPSSNPTWSVEDGVTGKKVLFVKGHNPWRIAVCFVFWLIWSIWQNDTLLVGDFNHVEHISQQRNLFNLQVLTPTT